MRIIRYWMGQGGQHEQLVRTVCTVYNALLEFETVIVQ
jgi:hypothetical protein